MKRKQNKGSMQLQGEIGELAIENMLISFLLGYSEEIKRCQ